MIEPVEGLFIICTDNDSKSISFNEVHVIKPDAKGNLWMGTSGGGLDFFDLAKQAFKPMATARKKTRTPVWPKVAFWLHGCHLTHRRRTLCICNNPPR